MIKNKILRITLLVMAFVVALVLTSVIASLDATEIESNSSATKDKEIKATEKMLPDEYMIENVPVLKQLELKAGCEVYACTVTLQYLGYDIDEFEFADKYLISSPITYDANFQRYGPDMNSAYAGDVYTIYGYGVNSPAMAKSMNKYLRTTDTDKKAVALKNVPLDELCEKYVINNIPVMVWATTYMHEPYVKADWIIDYVDENADSNIGDTEQWCQNEHCLALIGFDKEYYYFCDSVSGEISHYEKEVTNERYNQLGAQAIVVK